MERSSLRPDTIAAIATPPGRGGIGVVRMSGKGLGECARRLIARNPEPRRAELADFLDAQGSAIDRGLLLFFPAPHSYTGEDVIELQGHGGPVVMRLLLRRCVELGARLAEPGEFTQRAFLNGKLDLAQAESVADLIESTTEAAARSAMRSLSGRFSEETHGIAEELCELRGLIEATLDFPEDEVDVLETAQVRVRLRGIAERVESVIARGRQGRLLRDGLHVVLAGRPNVGKSSLLNRLAGDDRAIVTDVPGTTRDAVRETVQVEGIPIHVIDTAGLRSTDDVVERLGIDRTWKEIEQADLVLLLADASLGITESERAIVRRLPSAIEKITVLNKNDLTSVPPGRELGEFGALVRLSAKTGVGVPVLREELLRVAGWTSGPQEDTILARERHLDALSATLTHITEAETALASLEFAAEELRLAHEAVQSITGEYSTDDLLGAIFSRFCIGK